MSDIEKARSQDIEKKPETSVRMLTYKIAFSSDDGQFINPHFGRAQYFLVAEIEGKKVVRTELRSNDSHASMPDRQHEHDHEHHQEHQHDPEHEALQGQAHSRIFDILYDVDIIIAGNMGSSIYDQLVEHGYTVIKTDVSKIEDALNAYFKKEL